MTYLTFLIVFLGLPLALLALLHLRALLRRAGLSAPHALLLLAHVLLALVYTTPWDNYLVATGVWYYDPRLVLGLTLGWVPLEEYLFFILQPLLTGAWLFFLAPRFPSPAASPASPFTRYGLRSASVIALLWLASLVGLLSGSAPATYLSLLLVWALPPIALQLAVGADLLWQQRRLVAFTILSATLYLCAADRLAITAGTWTISPAHSFNRFILGLPVEEIIFFLLTNTLIVFGLTLGLSPVMQARLVGWRERLSGALSRAPLPQ